MNPSKMNNYLDLLTIRRSAALRDVRLLGGVAIVSLMCLFSLGMLGRVNGRSLYLAGGIILVFVIVALMAWVKLQVINSSIELAKNLSDS